MSEIPAMPSAVRFSHEAMNTTFDLRIPGEMQSHLRDVAKVCFETLDLLEQDLSRFIEGSDVSRINRMQAGEQLYVSQDTHTCLLQALELHQQTAGLFDVTLGARIEHLKSKHDGTPPAICGSLIIAPDQPLVQCDAPGREIDLGGIGKGYALDRLRQVLIEWEIESALLSAGGSTQLAHGPLAWPVALSGDRESIKIALQEQALSASGIGIQGSHIVHPDDDHEDGLGLSFTRVWLTDTTAASADAWSTAVMLMTGAQLSEFALARPNAIHVEDAHGIRPWYGL